MERNISSKTYRIKLQPYTFDVSINQNGFFRNINTISTPAAQMHFHTQYEIFFTKEAPFVINLEEKELTFSGNAVCVPPHLPHSVKHTQKTYHFRFEITQSDEKHGDLYNFNSLFTPDLSVFSVNEAIFTYLAKIKAALDTHSPHKEEKIAALLKLALLELLEANTPEEHFNEKTTVDDYLMIIEDFIHNRYAEQITLKDVSTALHLSEKQTSRIIRKRYHNSLSALLNEKRLQIAVSLLENTDLSVTEIARRVLGDSDMYFYKLFKDKYGTTPLQYRKRKQQ